MSEEAKPEETVPMDPIDIASDLLYKVLVGLDDSITDLRKMEGAKTILTFVQATAMLDLARSLRTTNKLLDVIAGEIERR